MPHFQHYAKKSNTYINKEKKVYIVKISSNGTGIGLNDATLSVEIKYAIISQTQPKTNTTYILYTIVSFCTRMHEILFTKTYCALILHCIPCAMHNALSLILSCLKTSKKPIINTNLHRKWLPLKRRHHSVGRRQTETFILNT